MNDAAILNAKLTLREAARNDFFLGAAVVIPVPHDFKGVRLSDQITLRRDGTWSWG